ncbi:hypothetical protein ACFFWD_22035 [Bradyrhizobium erythrophlei]|uniref:hypothetical protein n=1 Tax=Bradyrhizobium erythrophlei TaxID=1437360 RepID=UPI0035EDB430
MTLAAMSLGYGVVQLDVTIVNTALNAIGASLGGGVAELQWVPKRKRERLGSRPLLWSKCRHSRSKWLLPYCSISSIRD